jgi:anti-anti-sigma factor
MSSELQRGRQTHSNLQGVAVGNVVVNCQQTDSFSFAAINFFVRLGKLSRSRGGRMAFCNVSARARDMLRMTHLDRLWSVYATSEEALEGVDQGP